MFLGKYFPPSMVTKLKNEITNFRQLLDESLFEARECYKLSIHRCPNHNMLPFTQIDTFYNGLTLRHHDTINAAAGGTFMKRRLEECYDLIENMTAHHNDWDSSAQWSESSSSITSSSNTKITALKAEMAEINMNLMRVLQVNQQVKAVTPNCKTCGGPHSFNDCPTTVSNTQNVYAAIAYQGNTITNPKEDLKGITTRSGTAYQGPTIPTTTSSSSPVVKRQTEATKDTVHPTNNESTKDVQPPVVPTKSLILNCKPVTSPIIEPVASSDLNFNISFANALILMPKFGPSIKSLLTNKDKLDELARTPLNEHCSAVLLKRLPEKLGDPGKSLIPCDFPGMAECLALADLGASINLMPLCVWNKISLLDLSPTCMTLELTDRLISRSVGVAEDVFVKVGTFHFSADFVVVDFDADPRVPLILRRSFLKTERALIDVFEGELTLRVGKEAITFNLDQTSRYSANYNDMMANRIDFIDMACEEYSQEVLGFSDVISSGNPTPYYDLIFSTTSPTLTSFGNSDFLLEELDAFLALEDDPTLPKVDQSYVDTEGDILLLEAFLNDDPSLPPPNQGNYLPEVRKELKIYEAKSDKSSIDEPLEVELKDLPPHLKYAFLEGNDKFPVIIVKYLSVEEKTAFITVLKSHKRKPHSLVHTKRLLTAACLLGYAMHQARFKEKMLKRCEDTNLCLKWEKSHFMVKEGTILGHKISKEGIEVDKAKVDFIAKLSHLTAVKGIHSFLGHASFYRRKPLTFSRLATIDPSRDTMAQITQPRRGNKYILVAVDYLSKWVEAKALSINNARVVCKFLKNLFARFGTSRAIISDREMHFCNDQFAKVMLKFGVTHRLATPYHPQTSGQVEALKHANFDLQTAGDHRKVQLNELNELRDQVYENSLIYKEKTKRLHDLKIKDRVFNIGDRVLLFNSRLKIFSSKLKSHLSGPFTISHVFLYGIVELSQPDGPNFKVNGHRLKHYFKEDVPKMVVPDLQTFPNDH
nr:reverse transcriptase domain-containing protein [Tanacetum cinerariifolium]